MNVWLVHSPALAMVGDIVQFTGTVETDGTGTSSAWSFGDGTLGSGLAASHTYTQPGTYTVVLTATDACSYRAVGSATVSVRLPTYLPLTVRAYW
jgi:chitodextrinase